jgi:hypothetical protein
VEIKYTHLILIIFSIISSGCSCVSYSSNFWFGKRPPVLSTNATIYQQLRTEINHPISRINESLGCLTVGWKRIGVFGWEDMNYCVSVTGEVQQVAVSSDKFMTLDIEIQTFQVNDTIISPINPMFIRAEICMECLSFIQNAKSVQGAKVSISGKLMWDGDGFLEVHPQQISDVHFYFN